MKRGLEQDPEKDRYHGAGLRLSFHEFSIHGISKRQDHHEPVERIEDETRNKPEGVITDAVEVNSDWYEGCDNYGEPDCDKASDPRELGRLDFIRANEADKSAEADKDTRDFSYCNE